MLIQRFAVQVRTLILPLLFVLIVIPFLAFAISSTCIMTSAEAQSVPVGNDATSTSYKCESGTAEDGGPYCMCVGAIDCLKMERDGVCKEPLDPDTQCFAEDDDCYCEWNKKSVIDGFRSKSESDEQSILPESVDNVLRAPTDFNVSLSAADPRLIQVSWKSGSTRDFSFAVERMRKMKIFGVDTQIWEEIALVPVRNFSNTTKGLSHAYTDRGVRPDITYCYRVKSVKDTVSSNFTEPLCISLN